MLDEENTPGTQKSLIQWMISENESHDGKYTVTINTNDYSFAKSVADYANSVVAKKRRKNTVLPGQIGLLDVPA